MRKTISEKQMLTKVDGGSFREQIKQPRTAANIILFFIFITPNSCTTRMDHLGYIVEEITRRYFHAFTCIVYVVEDTRHLELIPINSTRMVIAWTAKASVDMLTKAYEDDCKGFVVSVSKGNRSAVVADFVLSYKNSRYSRYNNQRYLFLPVEEDNKDETAFLESESMYYMPNLVFVVISEKGFKVIGHNFFNGYKYDVLGIKKAVLDVWYPGKGFKYKVDLYPDKMKNLNGKLVVFSMLNHKPFGIVEHDRRCKTVYDGVDTRVAAQFVEDSNGTWMGLDNPLHQWGQLFDNGSGNGVFGAVSEHKADMGYSAIHQYFCDEFDCSRPYLFTDVTCLVPTPNFVAGWLTVVFPFQPAVWYFFFSVYVLSGFFIFFFALTWHKITGTPPRGLFESFYDTYRLLLGQVPPSAMGTTPLSKFYKMWGIYVFFMVLYWQCGIASILTVSRYEKAITSAAVMVERYPSLQWGATHTAWVENLRKAEDPVLQEIANKFVVTDAATLKERIPMKNFAYFTERLQNGYYALDTYVDAESIKYLRVMESNVYQGNVVIIMTRGSPYQEHLDKILIKMFDTGLIRKIEDEVTMQWLDKELQSRVRSSADHVIGEPRALSLFHIHGPLYIFATGILLSSAAFLIELISFQIKK